MPSMKEEQKTWYNIAMRILMALMLAPLAALGTTVSELPPSGFADTEVSTNIAFVVDRSEISRIEFTVALAATPTNNVEVAIGKDGNGDGNLSVEESAYVFGYDCCSWFCRARDEKKVETAALDLNLQPQPRLSHTFILKTKKLDETWNLVKVTRRGFGSVCELVKVEGRLPGFKLEVR